MTVNILAVDDVQDFREILSDNFKELNSVLTPEITIEFCIKDFTKDLFQYLDEKIDSLSLILLDLVNEFGEDRSLNGNKVIEYIYAKHELHVHKVVLFTADDDFHTEKSLIFYEQFPNYQIPPIIYRNEDQKQILKIISDKIILTDVPKQKMLSIMSSYSTSRSNFDSKLTYQKDDTTSRPKTIIEYKNILYIENSYHDKRRVAYKLGNGEAAFDIGSDLDNEIKKFIPFDLLLYKQNDSNCFFENCNEFIASNNYKMFVRLKGIILNLFQIHSFKKENNILFAVYKLELKNTKTSKNTLVAITEEQVILLNKVLSKSTSLYRKHYY